MKAQVRWGITLGALVALLNVVFLVAGWYRSVGGKARRAPNLIERHLEVDLVV